MQISSGILHHGALKPRAIEAAAFHLGAHGVNPEHMVREIEAKFDKETSETRETKLHALRTQEAKKERLRRERPEAEAVWNRAKKEYGDTPPPYFRALFLAVLSCMALGLDAIFLAPSMDILYVSNPVLQYMAAIGIAALCTAYFESVYAYYAAAGRDRNRKFTAMVVGALGIMSLATWGILRGYQMRFAAMQAGNPLGDFLGGHPALAATFYVFITVATPIVGATSIFTAWRDIAAAVTWRRTRRRFEELRAAELEAGRAVQSATDHLAAFDAQQEAACREWKAIFAQFYERGRVNGACKETHASVIRKSVVGGACVTPLAFLLPFAFIPELLGLAVLAGLACFTYFNHRRHHPSEKRYLALEHTHFAVDPDARELPEPRKPAPRQLTKGDSL